MEPMTKEHSKKERELDLAIGAGLVGLFFITLAIQAVNPKLDGLYIFCYFLMACLAGLIVYSGFLKAKRFFKG